jgi:hypothetical protein
MQSYKGMIEELHKKFYMGPSVRLFASYSTSHPLILELSQFSVVLSGGCLNNL